MRKNLAEEQNYYYHHRYRRSGFNTRGNRSRGRDAEQRISLRNIFLSGPLFSMNKTYGELLEKIAKLLEGNAFLRNLVVKL